MTFNTFVKNKYMESYVIIEINLILILCIKVKANWEKKPCFINISVPHSIKYTAWNSASPY